MTETVTLYVTVAAGGAAVASFSASTAVRVLSLRLPVAEDRATIQVTGMVNDKLEPHEYNAASGEPGFFRMTRPALLRASEQIHVGILSVASTERVVEVEIELELASAPPKLVLLPPADGRSARPPRTVRLVDGEELAVERRLALLGASPDEEIVFQGETQIQARTRIVDAFVEPHKRDARRVRGWVDLLALPATSRVPTLLRVRAVVPRASLWIVGVHGRRISWEVMADVATEADAGGRLVAKRRRIMLPSLVGRDVDIERLPSVRIIGDCGVPGRPGRISFRDVCFV